MVTIPNSEPYIQSLDKNWYRSKVACVDMLRLDVIHPKVSGNKWYKLKYNIEYCKQKGIDTILTFGGGYSNHLIATACAASHFGIKSIGIIRGEELQSSPSETLIKCKEYGMELVFVSREKYKERYNKDWHNELGDRYQAFVIPEGGANEQGRRGAGEIVNHIEQEYSHIAVPVGTGTTYVGLCNSISNADITGFAPMKKGEYLNEEVAPYIDSSFTRRIIDKYHFGGFGRNTLELIEFMNDFYEINKVPLDIVYTSKMMYGVRDMIMSDQYYKDARILCIHTGGLQGNNSIREQLVY